MQQDSTTNVVNNQVMGTTKAMEAPQTPAVTTNVIPASLFATPTPTRPKGMLKVPSIEVKTTANKLEPKVPVVVETTVPPPVEETKLPPPVEPTTPIVQTQEAETPNVEQQEIVKDEKLVLVEETAAVPPPEETVVEPATKESPVVEAASVPPVVSEDSPTEAFVDDTSVAVVEEPAKEQPPVDVSPQESVVPPSQVPPSPAEEVPTDMAPSVEEVEEEAENVDEKQQEQEPEPVSQPEPATSSVDEAALRQAFATERLQLQEQFAQQLQRMQDNFATEQAEAAQQHEALLQQTRASYDAELQTTQVQLDKAKRSNEGYRLKLDALQREVKGTQELLQQQAGTSTDLGAAVEEERIATAAAQASLLRVEGELAVVQAETKERVAELQAEKEKILERAKGLAGELKDRRMACREFETQVEELEQQKKELQGQVENLEFQLSDHTKSHSEKNDELEALRAQLVTKQSELESLQEVVANKDTQHEKALSDFKRKAQASLSLATSRANAAVQAKEDATMEARAARSTADNAMDRAMQAELDAKASTKRMEAERNAAVQEQEQATVQLSEAEQRMRDLQKELSSVQTTNDSTKKELEEVNESLIQEQTKSLGLEKDLATNTSRVEAMREEISALRQQMSTMESKPVEKTLPGEKTKESVTEEPVDRENMMILQEELAESRRAIADLKMALQNAVEEASPAASASQPHHDGLFYAMEKQAELNMARDEINRLANLLSDVQSERMEATEAANEMRERMEEAISQLQRYETLKKGNAQADASVNIEYLKNIVLRYLYAKTVAERKALIPVMGAVLCLTPDELTKVIENCGSESPTDSILDSISGYSSSWLGTK